MRLIDADALKGKKIYSEERHEYVIPVFDIDNAPTVDAAPEWISVKDGLPEFGDTIVIRFGDKTDIATFWRGELCPHWRGQWYGTIDLGSVTHWMPLPEPPKDGGEEE